MKWERVKLRTAARTVCWTQPPPPSRIRLDAQLQVPLELYIGIQVAAADADSYLAFYLNAFKRTPSKAVREQRGEQIADGVEIWCSHRGAMQMFIIHSANDGNLIIAGYCTRDRECKDLRVDAAAPPVATRALLQW